MDQPSKILMEDAKEQVVEHRTPLTSLLFAEICHQHLPPGVFNIITD